MRLEDLPSKAKKIIWYGSTVGGFEWLHERTQKWCQANANRVVWLQGEKSDNCDELIAIAATDTYRIIMACKNRWDFPQRAIEQLNKMVPEVPLSMAVSDWWLGWRRTGIGHFGPLPIICLPWFRWWDGWTQWLSGDCAAMMGPFPSSIPKTQLCGQELVKDRDLTPWKRLGNLHSIDSVAQQRNRVLVVGGCAAAMQSWQRLLSDTRRPVLYGHATLSKENVLMELMKDEKEELHSQDWILWDDSRLCTVRSPEVSLRQATSELSALARLFPKSRLWVAWTQPVWDIVRSLWEAGLDFELLAKPYFGNFSSAELERT